MSTLKQLEAELEAAPPRDRAPILARIALLAIKHRLEFGDATFATRALELLQKLKKEQQDRGSLIAYFEKFGHMRYKVAKNSFCVLKTREPLGWNEEIEHVLRAPPWQPQAPAKVPAGPLDANKEFRHLLDKFDRAMRDPSKSITHPELVKRIRETIYAYARTEEFEREDVASREPKKPRTVHDVGVARTSMNATKYAKQRVESIDLHSTLNTREDEGHLSFPQTGQHDSGGRSFPDGDGDARD